MDDIVPPHTLTGPGIRLPYAAVDPRRLVEAFLNPLTSEREKKVPHDRGDSRPLWLPLKTPLML